MALRRCSSDVSKAITELNQYQLGGRGLTVNERKSHDAGTFASLVTLTVEGDAEEEVDASGDEVAVHADRTAITQRSRR